MTKNRVTRNVNAPIRIRTHTADGKTVECEAASMADARAGAELETREGRVKACGIAAQHLLATGVPALVFIGSAMSAWLENGGSLERDFFRVVKPKSHRTPAAIWRQMRAHPDEDATRRS